ncbi:tumor necrosis factor ligand superfamily member 6-like [Lates japonicus]|uniref:Tumor necrosis factor ligand superfamily member 6-like protein n=1 Tax=Lates japonicus TaxID=270547 RepID=A0AAD3MAI3_LATJO|nr:tumor necrosis factor ligand superfamily member 6-like protein [Lates japonicus]
MSCDQSYPLPQVFLVDGGGGSSQHSAQQPNLIPCWSFPPPQERVRSRGKSRGFMGVSPCLAMIVLMLFLLVFAALGFEAFQIYKMQMELKEMKKVEPETEFITAEKQIGGYEPELHRESKEDRPAAHVTGRIETKTFPGSLRWEPKARPAFTSGGVAYQVEDGSLQVNESGLYHIYSRVELIFKNCDPTSSFLHSVSVRPTGHSPLKLMEAHRAGFCSQQPQHSWTTESYLASALKLQKYDKVYVTVSHPQLLSHAHYANFFGLYKI